MQCCGTGDWQGCFCVGELPLFLRVPRTERTAFAVVWSKVVSLLQKKKEEVAINAKSKSKAYRQALDFVPF